MSRTPSQFRIRAFTAILLVATGMGLAVTGIVNHFYAFSDVTAARHAWMSAHNLLGVLFLVFAVWHAVLNRRLLFSHMKSSSTGIFRISREAVWASGTIILLLAFVVGHALLGSK